jgi:hypothetical protein
MAQSVFKTEEDNKLEDEEPGAVIMTPLVVTEILNEHELEEKKHYKLQDLFLNYDSLTP